MDGHLKRASRANAFFVYKVTIRESKHASRATGGATTTLTYGADDELTGDVGGYFRFAYNANGDQTASACNGQGTAYAWDFDDHMTGIGGTALAYDAAGRQAGRTAGGVTTAYLYDGDSVLLEKQGGATTASYSYGNALTRKDGETPLFDGQGSERTVTDAGGAVQATLTLSAFGQTIASSGGSTDPYQYAATSRYMNDGDAGLALVGCRYYDAQVGAFISRDTYLDQLAYAYCDADPVNLVDPSGHVGVVSGIVGVVVAVAITGVATVAITAIVVATGGTAIPIVVATIAGGIGGAAGGATTAAIDGTSITSGAVSGAIVGAGTAAAGPGLALLGKETEVVVKEIEEE